MIIPHPLGRTPSDQQISWPNLLLKRSFAPRWWSSLRNPSRLEEVWLTILSMASGASMYALSLSFAVNVISAVDYPSRLFHNTCAPPWLRLIPRVLVEQIDLPPTHAQCATCSRLRAPPPPRRARDRRGPQRVHARALPAQAAARAAAPVAPP